MKKVWENPEVCNLEVDKTNEDEIGCNLYEGPKKKLSILSDYPEGTTPGTSGWWCCDCKRGIEKRCDGRDEYISNSGNGCSA